MAYSPREGGSLPATSSGSAWGAGDPPGMGYASTAAMPRYTSAGNRFTSQIPVSSLPPVPSYPSGTSRMGVLPPRRTFEHMAKRRPRWGLRFVLLLIVVGTVTYLSRPFVPWVDDHITQIEHTVQTLGRQYGFIDGTPAPLLPPSGTLLAGAQPAAVPPSPGVALARAPEPARGTLGRPDIQPISPAAAPPKGSLPAAALAGKVPAGALGARPAGRPVVAAGKPAVVAPGRVPRRRAYASARYRRRLAAARAAAVSAPAFAVAAPAPAVAAPAPAVAAPPVVAKPAAPPVKPAGGGDDLDQLMASAVPVGVTKSSDLDKKLATVQKGAEPAAAPKNAAASAGAPQLSRSDIQAVMKDVQNEMGDCYAKTGKGGPVDLKIDVAPDGEVRSVSSKGPFAGTPTGTCVESKVKATIFPESAGLRFDYRLMVR